MTIEMIIKKESKDPSHQSTMTTVVIFVFRVNLFVIITFIVHFWTQVIATILNMKSTTGKTSDGEESFTGKPKSFKG